MEVRVKIIAEMTKCYPGTHLEALNRVRELANNRGVRIEDVYVIASADQSAAREEFQGAHWNEVVSDRLQVHIATRKLLTDLCSNTADGETILVLSYDGAVLRAANEQRWNGVSVTGMPFSSVRTLDSDAGAARNRPRPGSWPFHGLIDLPCALHTLVKALQNRGSTSLESHMKSTDVRPAMAALDKRFAGNGGSTGTAGLVSALIRNAEAQGIIEVDRTFMPQTPLIWLKMAGASVPLPSVPGNQVEKPHHAQVIESPKPSAPIEHRSRKLEGFLRAQGMGPFVEARMAMYDAIG
jgi:hypothetical protein